MSFNKENVNEFSKKTSRRKSGLLSKSVLSPSELPNLSELNTEFAGYLDFVRSVQAENEVLKSDKETIISNCNEEIRKIKTTYGSEIDALRKALDECTQEKCTSEYHNEKLLEENNNIKIKFARKIEAINELEKKYEQAESTILKIRKEADECNILSLENKELSTYNAIINEQLSNEIKKRTEAESRALTLYDELEFLKKLNSNNMNINQLETPINTSNKNEEILSEMFDEELRTLREDLIEEFDEYKEQMENAFNAKLEELTVTNTKMNEKFNKMYTEKKVLQSENDQLHNDIASYEGKLAALNARDLRHTETLLKITKEHDDFTKDLLEENDHLKKKLQEMNVEIEALVNEKIEIEKETYLFRSMLKGEQSRCNISDTNTPRKRRMNDEENVITSWSKGSLKLICNDDYKGNYIQLHNGGENEINLNEWKIMIETDLGCELMYTFCPRTLDGGRTLKIWSRDMEDVVEDEDNVVMNAFLPRDDIFSCRLSNDVDEVEASFDWKKCSNKRKILKASIRKPVDSEVKRCAMM